MVNHAWHAVRIKMGHDLTRTTVAGKLAAGTLTFVAVVVSWVFFRASDFDTGLRILYAMVGGNGVSLPSVFASLFGPLAEQLKRTGVIFSLGGGAQFVMTYMWVISLMLIAFLMPNTQQLMSRFEPALNFVIDPKDNADRARHFPVWSPSVPWSVVIALIAAAGLLSLSHPTEFLYFQF